MKRAVVILIALRLISCNHEPAVAPESEAESTLVLEMEYERTQHAATPLQDGRILVTGGIGSGAEKFAEIFDPLTRAFSLAGELQVRRSGHSATLMQDGRVLIAGGADTLSAEVFSPTTGEFTLMGRMTRIRKLHSAVLLSNGQVLLSGGYSDQGMEATAEVFDPLSDSFSAVGSMGYQVPGQSRAIRRARHVSVSIDGGRALIVGGATESDVGNVGVEPLIFDAVQRTFHQVAGLSQGSAIHAGVRLEDGRILLVGLTGSIFDPLSDGFSPLLVERRAYPSLTALPSGGALVWGGDILAGTPIGELFSQGEDSFEGLFFDTISRTEHQAVILKSGELMVIGGRDPGSFKPIRTAEIISLPN